MSTLFMSHGLRPFPGLITRDGLPAQGSRLEMMNAILADVQAAGIDIGPVDEQGDVEDFWEDAIRIATTRRAAMAAGLKTERRSGTSDWSRADLAHRTGPLTRREQGGSHTVDDFERVLAALPHSMTGRSFASCMHDSEIADPPASHLIPHLLALHAAGHVKTGLGHPFRAPSGAAERVRHSEADAARGLAAARTGEGADHRRAPGVMVRWSRTARRKSNCAGVQVRAVTAGLLRCPRWSHLS